MTTTCKAIGKDVFVVFLCAVVIGLSYFLIGQKTSAISSSYFVPAPRHKDPDELDDILAKASMPNRTVIITTVNGAWMEQDGMIDLFLRSFRIGEGTQSLLNSLLLVALDGKAFSRCKEIHPHCYNLTTEGIDFSAEKVFMTKDYLKMMWRRILFLQNVLKRGYSFVFSISCGSVIRSKGFPKTRILRSLATDTTAIQGILQMNQTAASLLFGPTDELSSFIISGLKIVFLDTKYFSGFCQPRGKMEVICTMHANCCKGLKAKLADLNATLEDWTRFRSLNGTNSAAIAERRNVKWRAPNACLHSW